jgi:hypothetical protein
VQVHVHRLPPVVLRMMGDFLRAERAPVEIRGAGAIDQ